MKNQFQIVLFTLVFSLSISPIIANDIVSVFDQSLNMRISTYSLPTGWSIQQNIATNTNHPTQFFDQYQLDFLSQYSEVVHNFDPISFCPYLGETVELIWHRTMVQRLSRFGTFHGGEIHASYYGKYLYPELANTPGIQIIESYVKGTRNGQSFEGVCIGFLAYGDYASSINGLIILSPEGYLDQTVQSYATILSDVDRNTNWTNKFNQICQKKRQAYVDYTQKIMNYRAKVYRQWQQSNQAYTQAYSRYNSSFNEYISGKSTSSNHNTYTVQDEYNDHIQGVTSFDDSYLGYRVKQEGEYSYWYTDGAGNYYGTDDPSFDPNSLQGTWVRAYPVD